MSLPGFNWHPPLGANATAIRARLDALLSGWFQLAPALGGECYEAIWIGELKGRGKMFQLAPALGGECYVGGCVRWPNWPSRVSIGTRPWGRMLLFGACPAGDGRRLFQLAPALGGECYHRSDPIIVFPLPRFNWHPPLGANATCHPRATARLRTRTGFNWHPPLGANATTRSGSSCPTAKGVSIGTRPWGRMLPVIDSNQQPKYYLCFNWHPPLGANATWWDGSDGSRAL